MFRLRIKESCQIALCGALTACSMADLVGAPAPQDTKNYPDAVKSEAGALNFYRGVLDLQARALPAVVRSSGLLTDELRPHLNDLSLNLDQRVLPEDAGSSSFDQLQLIRVNAQQARGVLAEYAPQRPRALIGHLYAVEGMADILLADLHCSGIPLSVVNYRGDFVLKPGSHTEEVYRAAVVLFDSAIALAGDSLRLKYFAMLGKGRASLAIGEYDNAAAAVKDVPTDFMYNIAYVPRGGGTTNGFDRNALGQWISFTMGDNEGMNGLPYVAGGDPRTDTAAGTGQTAGSRAPMIVAKKYSDIAGRTPITLASGIEARLIEAEFALKHGNIREWLGILNSLRTTCEIDELCGVPAPAGTGGVANLPPLRDPATQPLPTGKSVDEARIDLLFAERAYWLYLTGHRQGDLRRLIRNYQRTENTVYPAGAYPYGTRLGFDYGRDVTIPVPPTEKQRNPLYKGCIHREA